MRKCLAKTITSVAVIAATAAQLSAFSVSAAEIGAEAGNYPRISITTKAGNGNELEKADDYVKATIKVVSPADASGDYSVLEETGKIKVRGNSTARAEKKPFNIKFDKKQNVLDMGKGKKWCLLANCFDPSLVRNYTAFEIAHELGLDYTPDCKFAELWLDGTYKGCYLVTDPIESGSNRIEIDTDADDFMVEYEAYRVEDLMAYVTTDDGSMRFSVSEPEMPDPADYKENEQEQYYTDKDAYDLKVNNISVIMNNVTETIKNGSYEEMCEVIDMESFVDYYVLNEIMKTCDFGWSSVNFYYSDGKLHAGPAWDFDLSSGNTNPEYPSLVETESEIAYTQNFTDFETNSSSEGLYAAGYNFYKYLTANDDFMNDVKTVFVEEQEYIRNLTADGGKLDQIYAENKEMFENNFAAVEEGGAGWVASKAYASTMRVPDATFEENFTFFKNWIADRNDWLFDTWIGHEFGEDGNCIHCGISKDDCSIAGHKYDGGSCTVCGKESPDQNKMLFTEGMTYGKIYDLKDYDFAHISGVKVKFKNDISNDFTGAVVLGNYAYSESINNSTCSGNTFEFSFNNLALWRAPDTISVYRWAGEDPVIESIEFIYTEDPAIPDDGVQITASEDGSFDISALDPETVESVTIVLKEEVYNGGGQIVFDNWSNSSFNITRASGRAFTVDVRNVSGRFNINLWGDSAEVEKVIVHQNIPEVIAEPEPEVIVEPVPDPIPEVIVEPEPEITVPEPLPEPDPEPVIIYELL